MSLRKKRIIGVVVPDIVLPHFLASIPEWNREYGNCQRIFVIITDPHMSLEHEKRKIENLAICAWKVSSPVCLQKKPEFAHFVALKEH